MLSKSEKDRVLAFVKKAYTLAHAPLGDYQPWKSEPQIPQVPQVPSFKMPEPRNSGKIKVPGQRETPYSNEEITAENNVLNSNKYIEGKAGIADFNFKGSSPEAKPKGSTQIPAFTKDNTVRNAAKMLGKPGKKLNIASDIAAGDMGSAAYGVAKMKLPIVSLGDRAVQTGKRLLDGNYTGAGLEMAGGLVPILPDAINAGMDITADTERRSEENRKKNLRNREVRGSFEARNTGIADHNGQDYVNTEDLELLGKLGFDYSCEEYLGLEKTSEALDVYSYIEKVAGVPKEVAKLIDAGQAFSGEYLKDMGYKLPKGYEVKGDLCCPLEKKAEEPLAPNFLKLSNGTVIDLNNLSYMLRHYSQDYHTVVSPKHIEGEPHISHVQSNITRQGDGWGGYGSPKINKSPQYTYIDDSGKKVGVTTGYHRPKDPYLRDIVNTQIRHRFNYHSPNAEKIDLPETFAKEIYDHLGGDDWFKLHHKGDKASHVSEMNELLKQKGFGYGITDQPKLVFDKYMQKVRKEINSSADADWTNKPIGGPPSTLLQKLKPYRKAIGIGAGVTGLGALAYHLYNKNKGQTAQPISDVEKTGQSFQQAGKEEKEPSEKPGLWANVHAKKARGEKAAKPGDADYPDKKQWKKLTKAASSLSALKKLIRQLRSSGVTVTKDPKEYAKIVVSRLKKETPGVGPTLKKLTSQVKENIPPSYNAADRVMYIPRKPPESITGHSRAGKLLAKKYRMSDAIMHEGGHALHHIDDPGLPFRQLTEHPFSFPSESLALERIANNNAINFMRDSNVPGNMIENYKQNFAKPGYGSYRKYMSWDRASLGSPAYSVENPAINNAGQLDKLYKPYADIMDEAMKRLNMPKQAEYKWHKSKDLHRDVTNGRHYPFSFLTGEAKELVDAIKKRDMANFKEEIGDTSYAAQMLAAQATGLNHPVYADLSKFHNREKIWKDIFKEKGSTYHPKHMEGGSNFAKPSKIIKALASAGIRISQKEAEKLANKYTGGKMEKEAAVAAWQRSEGKNPEGGLNAKGRASYKKETGGTLKAPVGESNPTGDRAKRQNSFCSRMCGMKSENTGSKAQGDPDSRINKSLRKWNCKCGEDHSSLFEKVACLIKESKGRCWEGYKPVPGKEPYSEDSCKPIAKKKEVKKEAADGNELRRLILAAYKGSQSSKQSLSAMGSKKGPRKPRSLPKHSDIAKDSYKERHQGIFPFLGSHQAEIAKNTIDPSYVMDPSKYLGKHAEFEAKIAMNLSYMKKAIRAARDAGTPILRTETQLAKHLGDHITPGLKKIPFVGERLQKGLADGLSTNLSRSGPVAFDAPLLGADRGFVYMPRNFTARAGQNYSPRATLLHELGHAEHFAEDPTTLGKVLRRPFQSNVDIAAKTNLRETIANNNAINGMRAGNVPEHLIDTYKTKVESPFYNSYAKSLDDTIKSPTGNMNLPQRIGHSFKTRAVNFGQRVRSSLKPKAPISPAPTNIPQFHKPLGGFNPGKPSGGINMSAFNKQYKKPEPFAPMSEIPTYTHPTAQEFNVPYSVD